MGKRKVFSIFLLSFFWICFGFLEKSTAQSLPELVIYTYDSFVARDGIGPAILPLFENKYHCRVRALSSGDGGQMLSRLQLDAQRGKSVAHLVVGIDQHIWEQAQSELEPWNGWIPKGYSHLIQDVKVGDGFLPYDFGILTFIADLQMLQKLKLKMPSSIYDLLKPEWRRNLILEDPRTSTPGLSFFLYTKSILGDSVWDFWRKLKGQWLTLTPGWDGAYGLFLKQEAPLMWSYVTTQAYHEEHGDFQKQAISFKEGQPFQIEGAAWVKGSLQSQEQKTLAKNFLEFLISPEVQMQIPKKLWMFPSRKDVRLPESYSRLPQPKKLIFSSGKNALKGKEIEKLLSRWNQVIRE